MPPRRGDPGVAEGIRIDEIRSGGQRAAEGFLKSQLAEAGKRTQQAEVALNSYRKRY